MNQGIILKTHHGTTADKDRINKDRITNIMAPTIRRVCQMIAAKTPFPPHTHARRCESNDPTGDPLAQLMPTCLATITPKLFSSGTPKHTGATPDNNNTTSSLINIPIFTLPRRPLHMV